MILVNQFWNFDKEEKSDVYNTLLKNCMNRHIKKIIVFIVGNTNVVLKHPKIQKVYVDDFLTTRKMIYDYLVYDDVYLISNNNVKFGKSVLNFYRFDFEEENPININGTVVYKRRNNIHTDEITEIDFSYKRKPKPKPKRSKSKDKSKDIKPVIETKFDDNYVPKEDKKEEVNKYKEPKVKQVEDLTKRKPKKGTTTKSKTTKSKTSKSKTTERTTESKKYQKPKEVSKPEVKPSEPKSEHKEEVKTRKIPIVDKQQTNPKPTSNRKVKNHRVIDSNFNRRNVNIVKQPRNSKNKVAIVIHLYYQDLWFYFKEKLESLDYNYDLYVTLNESSTVGQTEWLKIKIESFGAKVYILPNKGLDIGPFLYVMNLLFKKDKKYDYLIKLHSKKSIHNNIGDSWRNSLVDSLIGSDKILKDNVLKMNKDNKIGMLGSKEWILNDNQNYDNKYVQYYKNKLSISSRANRFVGGTMFMVDFSILENYFENKTMSIYDELEEGYFQDHMKPKKTHSLERILGFIVYDDNKVIG